MTMAKEHWYYGGRSSTLHTLLLSAQFDFDFDVEFNQYYTMGILKNPIHFFGKQADPKSNPQSSVLV